MTAIKPSYSEYKSTVADIRQKVIEAELVIKSPLGTNAKVDSLQARMHTLTQLRADLAKDFKQIKNFHHHGGAIGFWRRVVDFFKPMPAHSMAAIEMNKINRKLAELGKSAEMNALDADGFQSAQDVDELAEMAHKKPLPDAFKAGALKKGATPEITPELKAKRLQSLAVSVVNFFDKDKIVNAVQQRLASGGDKNMAVADDKLTFLRTSGLNGLALGDDQTVIDDFVGAIFDPSISKEDLKKWIREDGLEGRDIVRPKGFSSTQNPLGGLIDAVIVSADRAKINKLMMGVNDMTSVESARSKLNHLKVQGHHISLGEDGKLIKQFAAMLLNANVSVAEVDKWVNNQEQLTKPVS